ncbi:MAG: Na+/H+ antiporter subunit D, partial [Deltaproteobacteria bacterium]|nr:Na+/H+ antiporter subunit D [Deltaproteobacteria bacterium]
MRSLMPALPLLIPFATAILSLFFARSAAAQRRIGILGSLLLLAAALALLFTVRNDGILVLHAGNWPAPFGIALVIDLLSAIMVAMTGLMGLGVLVFAFGSVDAERVRFGFFPLFQFLLMGVCGAFTTGDLFNLYVWYEVMLMSSFALISLGGTPLQL